MTGTAQLNSSEAGTSGAGECLRLRLRGFSRRELVAHAERACECHFGECAWAISEAEFVPCVGTLGGRVRLVEGRFVATAC